MTIVLDTCALIWWSLDPQKLSNAAKQSCEQMEEDKSGILPSIAIWEIAIKIKNKKLDLGVDLKEYLVALKQSNAIRIIPINADIWMKSVSLDWTHKDPADRVVVAMAKSYQAPIITSDQKIRDFYSDIIW
ncbi:MAG: type II toxin-antitoxin system VapC family toxin [Cyanobacteria bacterium J06621_11]